jgi:hypothetical protein
LLGAFEIAKLHVDLAKRGEGDGETMTGAERFMQCHAAFRKRERLIVPMTHQRNVRLVVHDSREHVVGRDRHRETFTLPETRRRFIDATGLREQHGGQRVNECEMPSIARGMKRGGGFRQVLANNARVADLQSASS